MTSSDGGRIVSTTNRVMLDIETLGLNPGAAILSLGAVKITEDGLGEELHASISLESCQDAGLEIDAGTLEWWLDQDAAVQGILAGGRPLADVLVDFASFYGDAEEIWANSPSFDCAILAHAYDAVGIKEPWNFWEERDARTLAALPVAADVEEKGDAHNALDDARNQARMVVETLNRLEEILEVVR